MRGCMFRSMSLDEMKNIFAVTASALILVLSSCSGKASRIELLEETTGLHLPGEYQELKNVTREEGAFGSDFIITIILKLDERGMQQIIRQIKIASATKAAKSGTWERTQEGYRFTRNDENEITDATVNLVEKTIHFVFSDIYTYQSTTF